MEEKLAERREEDARHRKRKQDVERERSRVSEQMKNVEGIMTGAADIAKRIVKRADALEATAITESQHIDKDFSANMANSMKQDHDQKPLWVCPDGRIFLEAANSLYLQAYDFIGENLP